MAVLVLYIGRRSDSSGSYEGLNIDSTLSISTGGSSTLSVGEIKTANIANDAVTFAKIENGGAGTIIGRRSDSSGSYEGLNIDSTLSISIGGSSTLSVGEIVEANIADGAVTAAKLATDSVTNTKIVNLNITASKLATNAVETTKINALAVTAAKLATGSVETDKINALAVTAAKLATNAVETDKINASAVTAAKLATDSVETAKILNDTVTFAKIVNASTGSVLIGRGTDGEGSFGEMMIDSTLSITGTSTPVLSVGEIQTTNISDLAVTNAKLATNAVETSNIQATSVTFGKLLDASTGSVLIGRGTNGEGSYKEMMIDSTLSITGTGSPVLSVGEIQTPNIANAAVTTDKLIADAVTFAKLLNASTGSVLIGRGTNGEGSYKEMMIDSTLDITGTSSPVLSVGEIVTANIADSAITTIKINDLAVTASKLNTSSVATSNIQADAVTFGKIQNASAGTIIGRRSDSGGSYEALTVDTTLSISSGGSPVLSVGEIQTTNIANAAVTTDKLIADAVTFAKLLNASTGSVLIGRGTNGEGSYREMMIDSTLSITGTGLPVLSVGEIASANIADSAITTIKINDHAVTGSKMATGTIETYNIGDAAITTDKLIADAVTFGEAIKRFNWICSHWERYQRRRKL